MLANETKTKIQELCARDEVRIVQTRVLSLTHGFGLGHATFGPFGPVWRNITVRSG
jgi:hypothetical protein